MVLLQHDDQVITHDHFLAVLQIAVVVDHVPGAADVRGVKGNRVAVGLYQNILDGFIVGALFQIVVDSNEAVADEAELHVSVNAVAAVDMIIFQFPELHGAAGPLPVNFRIWQVHQLHHLVHIHLELDAGCKGWRGGFLRQGGTCRDGYHQGQSQ